VPPFVEESESGQELEAVSCPDLRSEEESAGESSTIMEVDEEKEAEEVAEDPTPAGAQRVPAGGSLMLEEPAATQDAVVNFTEPLDRTRLRLSQAILKRAFPGIKDTELWAVIAARDN
jgi:hypothetical protein